MNKKNLYRNSLRDYQSASSYTLPLIIHLLHLLHFLYFFSMALFYDSGSDKLQPKLQPRENLESP